MQTLGVLPEVQYNSSQLISYHRVDGDLDNFLFVAASPATYAVSTKTKVYAAQADVILPRRGANVAPLLMNLWTGEVTPIAQYEELSDTQIKVHISLEAYQATMITLAPLKKTLVHAVATTAQLIRRDQTGLYVRSNVSGTYTTELSTGKTVKSTIGTIPPTLELTNWTLSVDDWQPTDDILSPDTNHVQHKLQLDTLKPWTSFPELEDVSGIGSYSTTFDLGADWPADAGAVLNIPTFTGSFRLRVNGEKLPPQDQLATMFDVSPWLKKGSNKIEVEVATPLLNRLRVADPSVYGVAARQDYGLVGPVTLLPYREVKICRGR
jgi:hypothetical protein